MACSRCGGVGWTCEKHPDQPFRHGDCYAAGVQCPVCQPAQRIMSNTGVEPDLRGRHGLPRVDLDEEPWWLFESKIFVVGDALVWFSTAWPFVHVERGAAKIEPQPRDTRVCPKCGAPVQWQAVETGWQNDCGSCGYIWWRPS